MAYSVDFYEQLYPMDAPGRSAAQARRPLFRLETSGSLALKPGDVVDAASWLCDGRPCQLRVVRVEHQYRGTVLERLLVFVNVLRGTSSPDFRTGGPQFASSAVMV